MKYLLLFFLFKCVLGDLKQVKIPVHLQGFHRQEINSEAVYAGRDSSGHHVYYTDQHYKKTHPSIKTKPHAVSFDMNVCINSEILVARFADKQSMQKFEALCKTMKIKSTREIDFINNNVVRAVIKSKHPDKMHTFCQHLRKAETKIAHIEFSRKKHRVLNHEARMEPFQSSSGVPYFTPDRKLRGEGEIVVVADTEADLSHCSIPGNAEQFESVEAFSQAYPDKNTLMQSDSNFFYIGNQAPYSYGNHMNHVVTTCAGNITVEGKKKYSGVASNSKVIAVGFPLEGEYLVIDNLGGILLATYNAGARIWSFSWNNEFPEYDLFSYTVDAFMKLYSDALVVVASGNAGKINTVGSPANAKNCVAVGACKKGYEESQMLSFSSYGSIYGMQKPEVVAPGILMSSMSNTTCGIGKKEGTSMSTPVVSGFSVILRQWIRQEHPEWAEVHSSTIKAALYLSAVPIKSAQSVENIAPYNQQGFGKIGIRDWSVINVMQFDYTPFSIACSTSGDIIIAANEHPSLIQGEVGVNYLVVCKNNEQCFSSKNHFFFFSANAGDIFYVVSAKRDEQISKVSVGLYYANCNKVAFENFNSSLLENIKYQDGSPYEYNIHNTISKSIYPVLISVGSALLIILISTVTVRVLEHRRKPKIL